MTGVLGRAAKPETVSEQQFDYFNDELRKMARMDWDQVPDDHLWYYFHDLAYVELQPDLFRHLFPACLRYWYDTLMRSEDASLGDSDFHYGLMRGKVLEKMLSERERRALYNFFRDGFLDRIETESGLALEHSHDPLCNRAANAWIFRLNSLGIVAPVIQPIWEEWWQVDHPGKAACAVMYASGLTYLKGENPIFGTWTRDRGGGGPYLTEFDGSLFDWSWLTENLCFLRETLSVDYVIRKLAQAAEALSNRPGASVARQVAEDAPSKRDVIELRIGDLLDNLGRVHLSKDLWE